MDAVKILGSLLGGNQTGSSRLEKMAGRSSGGGGAGDLLGSLLGGGQKGGGLLGAALSGLAQSKGGGNLGGLLGGLLGGGGAAPEPEPPTPELQDQAKVLIQAMCNAAKVDGQIDASEQNNILGRLGDVSQEEMDFVRSELTAPLDLAGFCRDVPAGQAQQVYGLSVMTIKLDSLKEAAYLGRLAQGLGLDNNTCNQAHQQVGAPIIFS